MFLTNPREPHVVPTIGGKPNRPHRMLARLPCAVLIAVAGMAASAAPARGQQLVASPETPAAAQTEPGVARWSNRPRLQFGDVLRLDLRARIQSELRLRDGTEDPDDEISLRDRFSVPRRRVGVEGVLFERLEFQIERELRDDTNPWRDVYADLRVHRSFRVRAGQFKVPFSLEQLTSAYDLDFVSRSSVVGDLAPGRDIGVMAHGRVADQAVKYEVGVFRFGKSAGLPALTATDLPALTADRTLAARVTVAPLRDGNSRGSDELELGVALLQNALPEGRFGLPGHFLLGETFFQRMYVNGTRRRIGFSGKWDRGRTRLSGELIRSADSRLGQAVDNSDLSDLISQGWYASAVHRVVKSGKKSRGIGDVDIAVRLEHLSFGSADDTDPPFLNPRANNVATIGKDALTLGATWSVNRWVKIQANSIREQITDPFNTLLNPPAPVWSMVLRFQVAM